MNVFIPDYKDIYTFGYFVVGELKPFFWIYKKVHDEVERLLFHQRIHIVLLDLYTRVTSHIHLNL